MFGSSFNAVKAEVAFNLCVQRIRLQINKREAQIQALRKEVADLLRRDKRDSAKIKVESIIATQAFKEAYEKMALYCELLAVRSAFLEKTKGVPADMQEAVATVLFAGTRMQGELPEMATIGQQFMNKCGREYVTQCMGEETAVKAGVNERVLFLLTARTPSGEEKYSELETVVKNLKVEGIDLEALRRELAPPIPPYPLVNLSTFPPGPNTRTILEVPEPHRGQAAPLPQGGIPGPSTPVPAPAAPSPALTPGPGPSTQVPYDKLEPGEGGMPRIDPSAAPSAPAPPPPGYITVEEAARMAQVAAEQATQRILQQQAQSALGGGGGGTTGVGVPYQGDAGRFPQVVSGVPVSMAGMTSYPNVSYDQQAAANPTQPEYHGNGNGGGGFGAAAPPSVHVPVQAQAPPAPAVVVAPVAPPPNSLADLEARLGALRR